MGSVKISVTGWQSVTSVAWSAVCANLLGIVFPHLEKGWWNGCTWKTVWCGSKAALGAVRCLRIAAFPRVGSSAGIGGTRLMLPWAGVRWSSTCPCVGLPPGREKEPVAVRLASHPGIEVICLHGSAPMPRRPVQGLRAPCRLCRPVAFVGHPRHRCRTHGDRSPPLPPGAWLRHRPRQSIRTPAWRNGWSREHESATKQFTDYWRRPGRSAPSGGSWVWPGTPRNATFTARTSMASSAEPCAPRAWMTTSPT